MKEKYQNMGLTSFAVFIICGLAIAFSFDWRLCVGIIGGMAFLFGWFCVEMDDKTKKSDDDKPLKPR